MSKKDQRMIVPRKWGKLMTSRKVIQEEFERKLDQARKASIADALDGADGLDFSFLEIDYDAEKIRNRLQTIQDRHPEFLKDLAYLVEPLARADDSQREKMRSQRDNTQQDRIELNQVMEKKGRPLSHLNREEIQKTCRRYGLGRTWDDLLVMLNQVNSAASGKLFDKQKQ